MNFQILLTFRKEVYGGSIQGDHQGEAQKGYVETKEILQKVLQAEELIIQEALPAEEKCITFQFIF